MRAHPVHELTLADAGRQGPDQMRCERSNRRFSASVTGTPVTTAESGTFDAATSNA
jgi:hypothetical protein